MSDLLGNHIVGFPTRRLKYALHYMLLVPSFITGPDEGLHRHDDH